MRSIWSGTISFGLVSVGVRMFPATESKELRFHFLDKRDLTPVGYEKVRKDDRKPVPAEDVVRGFEVDKGRYVEIGDEDLDRLDIELTHSIDICDFVALEEIDPIYYRKPYYLLPTQGAEKPYRLLVRALAETGKVGIAKVVIRNKQHLACLRTYEDYLLLETMYYPDEIRNPASLDGDIGAARLQKAEVEMATALVENLGEPFKPEKYTDAYRKELLDLIRAKAKGRKLPEPEAEEEEEVVDLMTALREYRRKRDPKKTPEPFGGKKRGKEPIFVVQRHDARRLHYDFRLERDGALASWAVPKGVPLEAGQRALAVHVEDHPLEYATFAGEIPKGQYGAGTVEIWDDGTYELVEEKRDGGLTVRLHGKRLEGTWALVPAKLDGDPKNWLLIRKREQGFAREHREYEPMLATLADSVPRGENWTH